MDARTKDDCGAPVVPKPHRFDFGGSRVQLVYTPWTNHTVERYLDWPIDSSLKNHVQGLVGREIFFKIGAALTKICNELVPSLVQLYRPQQPTVAAPINLLHENVQETEFIE